MISTSSITLLNLIGNTGDAMYAIERLLRIAILYVLVKAMLHYYVSFCITGHCMYQAICENSLVHSRYIDPCTIDSYTLYV